MHGSISPRTNNLLRQLPEPVYRRIRPCLEFSEYDRGDQLVQEGTATRHIYFPVSGIVARMIVDSHGHSSQFGICGNEGAIGLSGLSGSDPGEALGTSLVVLKTAAYRCAATVVDRELEFVELRSLVIRYFRYVIDEAMIAAFCNKHHTLHQQLCRLLLMVTDRASSTEIQTTHQVIAELLGSRREGITELTGRLVRANMLVHTRGMLRITDREALLQHACDCYDRLRSRYTSLLNAGHSREDEQKKGARQPARSGRPRY